MLKQSLIYLLLSILIVLLAEYAHLLILYIDMFYTYINVKLAPIFSHTSVGIMTLKIFTLVLIPVVLASTPALGYRLIKGRHMPYFIETAWLFWLVIVLSKILI